MASNASWRELTVINWVRPAWLSSLSVYWAASFALAYLSFVALVYVKWGTWFEIFAGFFFYSTTPTGEWKFQLVRGGLDNLLKTGDLGGRPYDVVLGPGGHLLYVSDWSRKQVLAVDPVELRTVARIAVGKRSLR